MNKADDVFGLAAEFESHIDLLRAAEKSYEQGYRKMDAYTPFPIEGLAEALGKRNRVPLMAFIGGIIGGAGAYYMMWYANVVPRGEAQVNDAFHIGMTNGVYVTQLPMQLTPKLLARGHERFDAICAECHGRTGDGNGMVVQRGFPVPPSYHLDRMRNAPLGHFFDVITNGYGAMFSYAAQVEPQDRWAIAAYIRALQLSQHANPNDLPPDVRNKLEAESK